MLRMERYWTSKKRWIRNYEVWKVSCLRLHGSCYWDDLASWIQVFRYRNSKGPFSITFMSLHQSNSIDPTKWIRTQKTLQLGLKCSEFELSSDLSPRPREDLSLFNMSLPPSTRQTFCNFQPHFQIRNMVWQETKSPILSVNIPVEVW